MKRIERFPLSLKFGITGVFSSSNGPSGDPIATPSTSMKYRY